MRDPAIPRGQPRTRSYRDGKQVWTTGLLYEDGGRIHLTELGAATLRWLVIINATESCWFATRPMLWPHASCTRLALKYGNEVESSVRVHLRRAILSLDGRSGSDELNREIFKVTNEDELATTIDAIRGARAANDITMLGDETVSGKAKNDRIIPWMSLASFGWTLFPDKRGGEGGDYYELDAHTLAVVREAAKVRHKHRVFSSVADYVEHVARCAALPKDLR